MFYPTGLDLSPDVEHICDPPAEVQPGSRSDQQAVQHQGRQGGERDQHGRQGSHQSDRSHSPRHSLQAGLSIVTHWLTDSY